MPVPLGTSPTMLPSGAKLSVSLLIDSLSKHNRVVVINEMGNHDDHSAVMLSVAMAAYFENNERVEVYMAPSKFHYYQFGKNLFGFTHGDTVKPADLGMVMANDKPEAWGQTAHRYWLTGHIHQRKVIELPGCMVESFNTLAAKDAWTAAKGYRSNRLMEFIVYHKEYGEIERHRIGIGEIEKV
jgi:hypothetical protein